MKIKSHPWALLKYESNRGLLRATGFEESTYSILLILQHSLADLSHRREHPWVDDPRMKKTKVGNWITGVCIFIGFAVSGYIMYTGVQEAKLPDVSLVLIIVPNFC